MIELVDKELMSKDIGIFSFHFLLMIIMISFRGCKYFYTRIADR